MNDLTIYSKYLPNFLFILLRAGIFFALLPLYGNKNLPAHFKIGFVIAIALVLTPVVDVKATTNDIPILVFREIIFGLALGAIARLVFFAVEITGQMISLAMGLSMASVFNPEMGQSTEVGTLYGIFAMLIFLAMDAHHDLIYVFVKSYEWLPSGHIEIKNLILTKVMASAGSMFVIAIKMSAPVVIVMLVVNIVLGFIYKAAPQMNVFFVSYPVYIFVGFIVLLISFPVFTHVLSGYFNSIKDEMYRVISIAGAGG